MEKYLPVFLLIVVCFLGIATSYSAVEKRDLHRIILKERRPRSHRSHSHRHHHKPHHHDFGSYENFGKHGKHHDYDHSFDHYDSRENSYEEVPIMKYKSHHHSYHKVPKTKPYYSSMEYEDDKMERHREDWSDLDSFDDHRTRRRPRKQSKRYSSPLDIELTTKYPTTSSYYSFFDDTGYSSFNVNQKTLDLGQPSPITEYASAYDFNNTYQVRENHHQDDRDFHKDLGFQVLGPTLAISKHLTAEESNEQGKMYRRTPGRTGRAN